jgi:hypothetical protein
LRADRNLREHVKEVDRVLDLLSYQDIRHRNQGENKKLGAKISKGAALSAELEKSQSALLAQEPSK